jgi:hypothetical protein
MDEGANRAMVTPANRIPTLVIVGETRARRARA